VGVPCARGSRRWGCDATGVGGGPGTRETVELLAIAVKKVAVRCLWLTDGGI